MNKSVLLLALLPALAHAAGPAPIFLQALTPTSGANPSAVLDGDAKTGWVPVGDPRDEGLLFRFETPIRMNAIAVAPCANVVGSIRLEISADGNEVATIVARNHGKEEPLDHAPLPGGEHGLRSVFLRIAEPDPSRTRPCISEVAFLMGETRLALRPPRSVPGRVTASSTLAPVDAYHPSYLFDGRLDFGWVEGAKGLGEGEWVGVHLDRPAEMSALEIWNGYQRSEDHFRKNARARKVSLEADGKRVAVFPLKDAMGSQKLALPAPVQASDLKLVVEEATAGTRYPDLVISELRFWDSSGPFTVATQDAPEREAALKAEIGTGPLAKLVDRRLSAVCGAGRSSEDASRTLKLRTNHTFVGYDERAVGGGRRKDVSDGVWVPTRAAGPWAEIELYGRRHRVETSWRAYEEAAARETDRIIGGRVELARLEDLGAAGFAALIAEWKKGPARLQAACVTDAAARFDELARRGGLVVRGPAFTDLLVERAP